ncbi:hypothetical protein F0P96_19425 [Hymenobacter busanensis]|uniref:Uncharacterized protein n=1 Tax=Hymenobacter busanensis TaxID=2607656 RepID=A0A7L4ZTT9_9BACT|nr:hypothetical protein [Hymenobacter busanensis]KAA9325935.1 hypothetical protein F0P96_19425 [Hymenobacter busanensis]QHJ06226.1 hypothetical protein GUY19_02500 [Hymenobacter busanensis]
MSKFVLLFAVLLVFGGGSISVEAHGAGTTVTAARPMPRSTRAMQRKKAYVHRPNYTRYKGAGNPFRGLLAWVH